MKCCIPAAVASSHFHTCQGPPRQILDLAFWLRFYKQKLSFEGTLKTRFRGNPKIVDSTNFGSADQSSILEHIMPVAWLFETVSTCSALSGQIGVVALYILHNSRHLELST